MDISLSRIKKGYEDLLNSDDYKNFNRNKKLFEGKSKDVFSTEVVARVNLQYMGLINKSGQMKTLVHKEGNKFSFEYKTRFSDLIVGDNILKSTAQVYGELAADKPPLIDFKEEEGKEGGKEKEKEFIEKFDLKKSVGDVVKKVTYGGSVVLKGTSENGKINFLVVERTNFFTIKNQITPDKIDAIVVYWYEKNNDSEKIHAEIYQEGKVDYKSYNIKENKIDSEIPKENKSNTKSNTLDTNQFNGWQVAVVEDPSDYDEDTVSNVRELIIGDTLASQSLDKVANPLLQIPDDMTETDENGNAKINIQERIVVVGGDSTRDVKQIELETKIQDWNMQRKTYLNKIYTSLAINENVLGIGEKGMGDSSGEAIKKSYQRTISRVNTKRNKIYNALETVLKWGYSYANKKAVLEIEISGQDIIEKSEKEQVELTGKKIDNLTKILDMQNEAELMKKADQLKGEILKEL